MTFLSTLAVLLATVSFSFQQSVGPAPGQIKNIVTFGDSYSDVVLAGDGGTAWPIYVADYANLTLFPQAAAGATCTDKLTPRIYPSVFESQLPTYFAEVANGTITANINETIFTLWIGTNDIGVGELLTGQQNPGATIVQTSACVVDWVQTLYDSGARNFIFQNMIPLEKTILYSPDSYPNHYWNLPRNTTEWSLFITEMSHAGNALTKLMLENKAKNLTDAHLGYFDSHGLFTDMYNNPQNYFNGTAPLNVTGAVFPCVEPLAGENGTTFCSPSFGSDADSFMWYDELHPSEQSDRNLARRLADAIMRNESDTQWITWFS